MRCHWALWLVLIVVAPARADDADMKAVRVVLDTQLAALAKHDVKAFAATFLTDKGETTRAVFIPSGSDAVFAGTEAIERGVSSWAPQKWKLAGASFVGAPKIVFAASAAEVVGNVSIRFAEDKAKGKTQQFDARLTALIVLESGTWRAAALMLSRAVADNKLRSRTFGGYDGDGGPLATLLDEPAALEKAFEGGADAIVIGTSPKERATGAAGAKLLARWRKLDLSIVGDADEFDGGGWAYGAATVMWTRKKEDVIVMTALVIARAGKLVSGGKGWRVSSVHFGAAD